MSSDGISIQPVTDLFEFMVKASSSPIDFKLAMSLKEMQLILTAIDEYLDNHPDEEDAKKMQKDLQESINQYYIDKAKVDAEEKVENKENDLNFKPFEIIETKNE